ncbi:unnamed protein product [Paramecium octaurelia]|uniref:Uncharacterized protein n=1 Tax=Paramecium octaurelia TaxID=43137 RepID=A0A8S1YE64_PAROT|nr:unnamed protein product [Paramecium octaurelia]
MQLFAYSFIVPSSVSIIYVILMICRYCQLKSDIVADEINLNCSLKFRVSVLICDIVQAFKVLSVHSYFSARIVKNINTMF